MISVPIISINQPIGTFYLGKMNAKQLISNTVIGRREDGNGPQRALNVRRVNEIEKYCQDPDATFPTPIIISVDSNMLQEFSEQSIIFEDEKIIGKIIDGQHRVKGLKKSDLIDSFELPVIFMIDLTKEEEAYVFSIINSNQVKVDKSVIYDLFDLFETKSPQKTAHYVARALNSDEESAFYRKLKMLGKKQDTAQSLSQGTFVYHILKLISKKPNEDAVDIKRNKQIKDDLNLPLRKYFIEEKDDVIFKIIRNYFNGVRKNFITEWDDNRNYILSKSTGYAALIKAFPHIYKRGEERKSLTEEFFTEEFAIVKKYFVDNEIEFTSKQFPSNEQMQNKLAKFIIDALS